MLHLCNELVLLWTWKLPSSIPGRSWWKYWAEQAVVLNQMAEMCRCAMYWWQDLSKTVTGIKVKHWAKHFRFWWCIDLKFTQGYPLVGFSKELSKCNSNTTKLSECVIPSILFKIHHFYEIICRTKWSHGNRNCKSLEVWK